MSYQSFIYIHTMSVEEFFSASICVQYHVLQLDLRSCFANYPYKEIKYEKTRFACLFNVRIHFLCLC